VPALLDRLEIWEILSLIALVLGLLAVIRSGVTALHITLCVWGAAMFIAFVFMGNVI
jgi:membrane-bound ClpP family serine protease